MNKDDTIRVVASIALLIANYFVFRGLYTITALVIAAISFGALHLNGFETKNKPIEYLAYIAAGVSGIQVLYLVFYMVNATN